MKANDRVAKNTPRKMFSMPFWAYWVQISTTLRESSTDARAAPWLTRHPEMPEWHLHLASIHDPLAQRMGAEMAMSLADLVRVGELRRLKICAAPDCEAALLDLSRNRSRMFCDTGNCGNRQHVAAYRERRSKETDDPVDG